MAYVKEVEWQGKIYDLFDKEARIKIQDLFDTVNNMDSNKANQADFENYKTTNDANVNKKENASNKVNEILFPSTDYFPSTKAVLDYVSSKLATPIADIEALKTDKADLVQSHNIFNWDKLLAVKSSIFTVSETADEGYHITGTTVNKYQQILINQKLQLDDGDYYISDSAINNTDVIVYCQLTLVDADGKSTYYNNTKVTIDNSKYTSIYLSVQTGGTVGEVDTIIYPKLCKYGDINVPYLPNRVAKGVALLAENMPEIKKDISDKANNIICVTDKSTSSVVTDSSQNPIKKLTLYGSSVQSSVPTPTAPVTIKNVNNPNITLYQKNLFDTSMAIVSMNSKAQLVEWDRQNCSLTFTSNADNINSGAFFRHATLIGVSQGYGVDYTKLNGKSVTLSFDIQSNTDCKINVQFTKYSNATLDISTTKQRLSVTEVVDTRKLNKALCFYLNNVEVTVTISNIQIEVNDAVTSYEKGKCSTLKIESVLHGTNNVCDTLVVNDDGTGYLVQNLQQLVLQSEDFDKLKESPSGTNTHRCTLTLTDATQFANSSVDYIPLCSALKYFSFASTEKFACFDVRTNTIYVDLSLSLDDTKTALKTCAVENGGITIIGARATPNIVELSKEQIEKALSLHTNYPCTTIISDCDCEVKYVADTKSYIDNKFKELAQVIVASADESEVM